MSKEALRGDEPFRPLRLASRSRLIVAFLVGPLLWVMAFAVAAVLVQRTHAIELAPTTLERDHFSSRSERLPTT